MRPRQIATPEQWRAAMREQMAREKALQRERDALAVARRALPWLPVERDYAFDDENGAVSLGQLFGAHSQLIVWHFMFGVDWEHPCPSCSFWADQYANIGPHLAARGVSLVVVSSAPIERLSALRQRMGWGFRWVSAADNGFSEWCGVRFSEAQRQSGELLYNHDTLPAGMDELPGLSVFARDEAGAIYRTYATFARGLDPLNTAYQHLDLVPAGRDEAGLDYPMAWLRLRDSY